MKHIDSHLHVRGESQYVDDVPPSPGMLHAAVAGSPKAHGIIIKLDTAAASAAPGVVAVLTAADIPGVNRFGPIIEDEELLVEREVCFVGHPIALVVARTAHQARQARELVEVEIDELPVVVDPRQAFANGDLIHPPRTMAAGDVAGAWSDCDVVVDGRCEIGGQEHLYLETQRARAVPGEDGAMQVFSSTQGPAAVQHVVSAVLGRPMHKVEVDVKRLGGGFGGKEDQATHWAAMAALAAAHLDAPVELVLNRLDDIRMTGKRHPYSADFRIGLTADGRILAYQATFYQNSGAFADLSPPVLARTLFHATNAYFIPNVRVTAAPCRTNLQPHTAFRGFGGPQGMYVIEAAINKAADAMGIEASAIQRANLLRDGDVFHYGQVVERSRAERTWDELESAFDVDGIRRRVDELQPRQLRGQERLRPDAGLLRHLVHQDPPQPGQRPGPRLRRRQRERDHRRHRDGPGHQQQRRVRGGAHLRDLAAAGTGREHQHHQGRQHVAERRQRHHRPEWQRGDHRRRAILDGMREVAAREIGSADPAAVTVADEQVRVGGEPADMSWTDLVGLTYRARRRLSAHGYYTTPGLHYDEEREHGHPFAYHVYGTAVFEVTVDCLRGTYAVDQVKIVHDLGRTINPTVDRGQVEGGLAQGMGWMTMEDLQWDAEGRCLSHALSTYKAPDVYFMPDDMAVKFLEPEDNPYGPLGAKAVGEPPLMYGIGVFFALRNAMKAFRPDADLTLDAPMTPERVLLDLHRGDMTRSTPPTAHGQPLEVRGST